MAASDPLVIGAGALLVLVGLVDAFLTILHPDRDGPVARGVNRALWRLASALARAWPARRDRTLAMAGAAMILADIVAWVALLVGGYALAFWPPLAATGASFADALYFSGATFSTLGYGDITPPPGVWQLLAVAESLTGFLVMTGSIAHVIAVFGGIDHRDAAALRVYSETGGTWDADELVERAYAAGGAELLHRRVEGWAALVRELHGRLYRFQGLAFYLRTQGLQHGPERMMHALAEAALVSSIASRSADLRAIRPGAEHLAIAFDHFARSVVRRHGSRAERREMEHGPREEDARSLRRRQRAIVERLRVAEPSGDPVEDDELMRLAARRRVFLAHVDAFTLWRDAAAADAD